jgi:hypothetical protein
LRPAGDGRRQNEYWEEDLGSEARSSSESRKVP